MLSRRWVMMEVRVGGVIAGAAGAHDELRAKARGVRKGWRWEQVGSTYRPPGVAPTSPPTENAGPIPDTAHASGMPPCIPHPTYRAYVRPPP